MRFALFILLNSLMQLINAATSTSIDNGYERMPFDNRSFYERDEDLIRYMASGGHSHNNLYKTEEGHSVGIKNQTEKTDLVIQNNIKKQANLPNEINWLRKKLTKSEWESHSNHKLIPRIALAVLIENNPEKVNIVNDFIRSIQPYTVQTHTSSLLTSNLPFGFIRELFGKMSQSTELEFDDFSISYWTRLFCMSENYPQTIQLDATTKQYMLDKLLKFEGREYNDTIPNTNASVIKLAAAQVYYPVTQTGLLNSENHLLMINGSAYIKNQIANPGMNESSELEKKLSKNLDHLYQAGLVEFNSIPYAGYTIEALLNLHDFAEEPIKSKATRVLDKIFSDYIIHSTHDGKNFHPFGRQVAKVENQSFVVDDPARAFIMTWLGMDSEYYRQQSTSRNSEFAMTALTTNYRLPKIVYAYATTYKEGYLAITGQPHGNAEISYKNSYKNGEEIKQYLLSGGGLSEEISSSDLVNIINTSNFNIDSVSQKYTEMKLRRFISEVVSRNPVLILDGPQSSLELKDAFYLGTGDAIKNSNPEDKYAKPIGPGIDSRGKNNTGIYFDFLVGPYPVHVPEQFKRKGIKPETKNKIARHWTLYEVDPGLNVAVFDDIVMNKQIGIILVLPGENQNIQALINTIANENKERHIIGTSVKFPDQSGSVMKGKTIRFNPYAKLDRYLIEGCDSIDFGIINRHIYKTRLSNIIHGEAPGWSSHSVIQNNPESSPHAFFDPAGALSTSYEFLNLNKLM